MLYNSKALTLMMSGNFRNFSIKFSAIGGFVRKKIMVLSLPSSWPTRIRLMLMP
jgi:hypothetical protein